MTAFGRLLSAPTIERGVEVCLRYRLGAYVGEVLAQAGHARTGLPNPADLVRVSEFRWPVPAQLTTVIVATPGTTGDVIEEADAYSATWDIRVSVLADLGDRLDTREAAQFYAAAAGAAVTHHGVAVVNPADGTWELDDDGDPLTLEGSSVKWAGESYRQLSPPAEHRALIAGEARLLVTVEDARAARPVAPIPLPDAPGSGERPEVPEGTPSPVRPRITVARDPLEE